MPSTYDTPRVRAELEPVWRVHYVSTCRSTNDLAARMRREGRLFAPAVVVTPRQTAGRGRGGNRWVSDPGTMTATFALPVDAGDAPHQLPIVAGLAVRDALAGLGADGGGRVNGVELKWPNDILVGGKKLAGLLCERVENVDLVGVGVNVSTRVGRLPKAVRERATSLELAGCGATVTEVLLVVAGALRRATRDREPFASTLRRYDLHHHLVGRMVTVRTSAQETVSGVCNGLDGTGRLLLRAAEGAGGAVGRAGTLHRLIAGQIISY